MEPTPYILLSRDNKLVGIHQQYDLYIGMLLLPKKILQ